MNKKIHFGTPGVNLINITLQWPLLNWITDNRISRLIESDLLSPKQTVLNIWKIHRLIESNESKSHLFASLQKYFSKSEENISKMIPKTYILIKN